MASPGEIFRHETFYADAQGNLQPKFLVVLAFTPSRDLVFRLLTSRQRDRRRDPPCFHGDPLPGYFVGILGGILDAESWVDLRPSEDYDGLSFEAERRNGTLRRIAALPQEMTRLVLDCAAQAPDTTNQQSRAIRDQLAGMPAARWPNFHSWRGSFAGYRLLSIWTHDTANM